MSQESAIERSPGLELLLRLVAAEAASRQCQSCGGTLSDSQITLQARDLQQVVIALVCRTCDQQVLVRVEPEAGPGTASVR
jgi:hypothetical protein